MKKHLFFAALASVALAGCVNDESNTAMDAPEPLVFEAPTLKTQTRAYNGEIAGVVYPTEESFQVFCRIYEGEFSGWASATDYFDAQGEKASHDASYWKTSTLHYWPSAGHALAFAAYSPYKDRLNDEATVTYGADGLTIANFKPAANSEDQYDLMYSDRVSGLTKENNGKSHVSLTFHHALASIVFSTSEAAEGISYKITDLRITGTIHPTGTFKQNLNETTNVADPKWTTSGSATVNYESEIPAAGINVTNTPTIFTAGESAMLLIPQNIPEDAKVIVKYEATTETAPITTTSHTVDIPLKEFMLVDNSTQTITEWEMGKRYIYRISFGETSHIYFKPSVTEWVSGGTAVYTINY
ncbi:MAG: fimbrillin family protein [Bacteroidaceae bacterium]|nr:fimbrillin family protein [Bacteroidaceae bacterium]